MQKDFIMEYTAKVMYEEPKIYPGFDSPFYVDYVVFDSEEEGRKFINGEAAYDYLDNTVRLRDKEKAIYLVDANGNMLWENEELKKECSKVIDYLKLNQFPEEPCTPGEKAAEYICSRIRDYYEDCDEDQLFQEAFITNNEYENMLRFCEAVQKTDLSEVPDFARYAYQMLDLKLNENIIANMEKACNEHYDTLLSSDIEYLLSDEPYEDLICRCNVEFKKDMSGVVLRPLTEDDEIQVEVLDEVTGNGVAEMLDAEDYAWGLFYGEELVGYCTLGGADDPTMGYDKYPEWTGDSLCLSDVFVKEDYRGQGLALKMINEVLEKANLEKASVFITVIDDRLSYLYEKLGFEMIDEGTMVKRAGDARIICDIYYKNEKKTWDLDLDNPKNQAFNEKILAINDMYGWLYHQGILEKTAFEFKDYSDMTYFAVDVKELEVYREDMMNSGLENARLAAKHIFDEVYTPCIYSGTIQPGWTMKTYRDYYGTVSSSWECELVKLMESETASEIYQIRKEKGVVEATKKVFEVTGFYPSDLEKNLKLDEQIADAKETQSMQSKDVDKKIKEVDKER